jgi:hypothetical protein
MVLLEMVSRPSGSKNDPGAVGETRAVRSSSGASVGTDDPEALGGVSLLLYAGLCLQPSPGGMGRRKIMRILIALPLLTLAACNVQNDSANDQMTLQYNQERLEEGVSDVANATESVASSVGNVAVSAGQAIRNEVGDIDVDVDVNRDRSGNAAGNAN